MKTRLQSIRIYVVLTLLTGIIYPLAMTGVAQLLFPKRGFLGELRVNVLQLNGLLGRLH
ncbi:MAG TPA: potassium-transporting ATPase subunit C [Chthoniobacterales bacterium]|nr:potassium-transporting ATPase subunit C [Chthoniobacterales bacterium]